jgi:hypothetical protein
VSKETSGILFARVSRENSQNVMLEQIAACSPWDINNNVTKICK